MAIVFHIYLATKTRWVHLEKTLELPAVPRVGEFVKFANSRMGDYFAFEISEVTYREGGRVEVMTALLNDVDARMYSFDDEAEFDEYYSSYLAEGWTAERGVGPNQRLLDRS